MKKLCIGLCGVFLSVSLYAQNIKPTLYVKSIKANKTVETQGDEVYFGVTEMPTQDKGSHKTVPQLPLYFSSKHFDKIKDISLWTKELSPGQSVEVIIGLVERDAPPWNTDDLIGTAKVRVSNQAGKMKVKWDEDPSNNQLQKTYQLNGEGADYMMTLQLK